MRTIFFRSHSTTLSIVGFISVPKLMSKFTLHDNFRLWSVVCATLGQWFTNVTSGESNYLSDEGRLWFTRIWRRRTHAIAHSRGIPSFRKTLVCLNAFGLQKPRTLNSLRPFVLSSPRRQFHSSLTYKIVLKNLFNALMLFSTERFVPPCNL